LFAFLSVFVLLLGNGFRDETENRVTIASVSHSSPAPAHRDATLVAKKKQRRTDFAAWGFLGPFIVIYLVFLLYPIVQGVYMGFYRWDLLSIDTREFIGVDNYVRMFWGPDMVWDPVHLLQWRIPGLVVIPFLIIAWMRNRMSGRLTLGLSLSLGLIFGWLAGFRPADESRWYDSQFWLAFGNTLAFVLMSTPLIVGVGLLLALAMNRSGKWTGLLRTLFFAPYVLSVAVMTLIWAFLLNPRLGLIGAVTEFLGGDPISFLTSTTWAMPTIVFATMWWTVGFNVVLFLAGLQDIDPTLYDAASIDGAGAWARFWNITLPGLSRTMLLVGVLQIIASFQIFGQVFIMTRGGPNGATRVSIQHIYESGFRDFELGYASAMSVFLFLVMIVVSAIQFRLQRSDR
jgi:multiple sugar transport system permease protein